MGEDATHELTVYRDEVLHGWVLHVGDSHVGGESSGDLVSTDSGGGVH